MNPREASRRGFSAANLEPAHEEATAGAVHPGQRVGRILATLVVLVVLVGEFVATLLAFHDPIKIAGSLLVGIPATIVIFRRPELGVMAIIALIPLQNLVSNYQDPLSLFKVLGGLTFGAFVLGWAFQGRYRLVNARQNKLVLAMAGVLLLSALANLHRAPDMTATSLRRFATLILFYFLVVNLVRTRRWLRITSWLIMIPVTLASLIAIASRFVGKNLFAYDYMAQKDYFRTVGTASDPNVFAATVLVGLPFFYYFFMVEKRRSVRIFLTGGFALALLAIVYTFSRGGAVALAAIVAYVAWRSRTWLSRSTMLRAGIGLALLAVVMLPLVPQNYSKRIASLANFQEDDSLKRRALYIVFGTDIVLHHPVLGTGPGTFPFMMDTDYRKKFPLRMREQHGVDIFTTRGRAAHNMYMGMASELGLVGGAVFGALLLVTWRHNRRLIGRFEREGPPEFLALARSLEVGYLSFLITSIFLSAEYEKYLWFLFAMPVVLEKVAGAPRAPVVARKSGVAAGAPMIAGPDAARHD